MPTVDLIDFKDLDVRQFRNLLLGNGFSIGIDHKFMYRTLYDAGVGLGSINLVEQQLFDVFSTKDFEYLLRKLAQASTVNKILNIDHLTPAQKYTLIRNALVRAVHLVHPNFNTLNSDWVSECAGFMRTFDSILSLNYDLFPYWISGSSDFEGFTDFFWSSGLIFDPFDIDVWGKKTKMYYPHGALFLFEDLEGDIGKIRLNEGQNVLDQISSHMENLNIPIFIAEETYQSKMRKIQQNPYLTFAYSRISQMNGGLVIYVTSLSSQDTHIINAIKKSSVYRIAVGLHVNGKTAFDIEAEKMTIQQKFQGKNIKFHFFDTKTCPLMYIS